MRPQWIVAALACHHKLCCRLVKGSTLKLVPFVEVTDAHYVYVCAAQCGAISCRIVRQNTRQRGNYPPRGGVVADGLSFLPTAEHAKLFGGGKRKGLTTRSSRLRLNLLRCAFCCRICRHN